MRPTVYVETSIPSYLTARPSRDLRVAAWQELTVQWWQEAGPHFELLTSELVVTEASRGHPEAAARRLVSLRDLSMLVIDSEVEELARQLVSDGGIPATARADALHVAVATVHDVEYLLTWNCRHIANAMTRSLMRSICSEAGYRFPEVCTPLELLPEERNDDQR